ncbi:DUF2892 domain-containing protein [Alteromonadaceae bacterium M269]|nr:DUF2892 domain-containing protein [Alteromonadaceae bacterium M269]
MWLARDNVGVLDTAVRSIVSTVLFALALEGIFSNTVSIALVVVSLILWTTCIVGLCPLYKLFGINTAEVSEKYHQSYAE